MGRGRAGSAVCSARRARTRVGGPAAFAARRCRWCAAQTPGAPHAARRKPRKGTGRQERGAGVEGARVRRKGLGRGWGDIGGGRGSSARTRRNRRTPVPG